MNVTINKDNYQGIRELAVARGVTTEVAADSVVKVGLTRLRAVANHYAKAKKAAKSKAKPARKAALKKAKAPRVPSAPAAPPPTPQEAS